MTITYRKAGAWTELVAIARAEIVLDKVENMLVGLEIPREEWPWLVWEELSDKNAEALRVWLETTDAEFLWFLPTHRVKPNQRAD